MIVATSFSHGNFYFLFSLLLDWILLRNLFCWFLSNQLKTLVHTLKVQYTVQYAFINQCCGSGSTGSTCFGPPGSGSTSQRYGSGSGSFYHYAKIVLINIESYYFVTLFDFLSLKNDVNVPSKVISRKNCVKKLVFCWHLEGQWRKEQDSDQGSGSESGSGSISLRHGSTDPDPPQNVMDPQHCI